MDKLDQLAQTDQGMANLLALVDSITPDQRVRLARVVKEDTSARRPQGSAYSDKWAHNGIEGKVRSAARYGRTRRCCPTCLELDKLTETADAFPYCPDHAIGPYRDMMRRLVISALAYGPVNWAEYDEQVRLDKEAKQARTHRSTQPVNKEAIAAVMAELAMMSKKGT